MKRASFPASVAPKVEEKDYLKESCREGSHVPVTLGGVGGVWIDIRTEEVERANNIFTTKKAQSISRVST